MYPKAPEKFLERFDDIIESMHRIDQWKRMSTLHLLSLIAKDKPDVFHNFIIDYYLNCSQFLHFLYCTFALHWCLIVIIYVTLWQTRICALQVFSSEAIDVVAAELTEEHTVHMAFQILGPLAETRPEQIVQYDENIIDAIKRLKHLGFVGNGILVSLSKLSEVSIRFPE